MRKTDRGFVKVDFIEITLGMRIDKKDPAYQTVLDAITRGGDSVKIAADGRVIPLRLNRQKSLPIDDSFDVTVRAMEQSSGDVTEAAGRLKIGKDALYARLKRYEDQGRISRPGSRWARVERVPNK